MGSFVPTRIGHRGGFSLVEIVVAMMLISLAAGALAPVALRQLAGNRAATTLEKLKRIHVAMVGDLEAGDYGYLGDFGLLPANLVDLNTRGAQPAYAIDAQYGIGAGYNGPYVRHAASGAAFVDSWGQAFQYTAGVAQASSAGPDRAFGTADDLVFPDAAPSLGGSLTFSVQGIPNDGSPVEILQAADVNLTVFSPVAGTLTSAAVPDVDPLQLTGLAPGFHGVLVQGEGTYAGVTQRSVVELRRGARVVTLRIEEP